ncbi:MAG TPA: phosphatase PAP2 family protein [Gemmatimonadaceae bacterium]
MTETPARWTPWAIGFVVTAVLVVSSMAYLDRPFADWVYSDLRSEVLDRSMRAGFTVLSATLVCMLFWLTFAGMRAVLGQAVDRRSDLLLVSWSATLALALIEILKGIFGRSSPYPTWVVERNYYFRPVNPSGGAFPSGTTAIAAAALLTFATRQPRFRPACIAAIIVIAVALPLDNAHWISDVVGGVFVGVLASRVTLALLTPAP